MNSKRMKNKRIDIGAPTASSTYIIKKRIDKVTRYVDLKDKRILDVGCGDGGYTIELAKQARYIIGIDIEKERVCKAKKKLEQNKIKNIEIKLMSIYDMDFQDNSFDTIFLNEVIEHLPDQEKALRILCNLLSLNGILIIYAPNKLYPLETHGAYIGKYDLGFPIPFLSWLPECIRKFYTRAYIYTPRGITKMLRKCGFEVKVIDYLFPPLDQIQNNDVRILGRKMSSLLEDSPLKIFGMSLLVICEKSRENA